MVCKEAAGIYPCRVPSLLHHVLHNQQWILKHSKQLLRILIDTVYFLVNLYDSVQFVVPCIIMG